MSVLLSIKLALIQTPANTAQPRIWAVYNMMCAFTASAFATTRRTYPQRDGWVGLGGVPGSVPRWFTNNATKTLPCRLSMQHPQRDGWVGLGGVPRSVPTWFTNNATKTLLCQLSMQHPQRDGWVGLGGVPGSVPTWFTNNATKTLPCRLSMQQRNGWKWNTHTGWPTKSDEATYTAQIADFFLLSKVSCHISLWTTVYTPELIKSKQMIPERMLTQDEPFTRKDYTYNHFRFSTVAGHRVNLSSSVLRLLQ